MPVVPEVGGIMPPMSPMPIVMAVPPILPSITPSDAAFISAVVMADEAESPRAWPSNTVRGA